MTKIRAAVASVKSEIRGFSFPRYRKPSVAGFAALSLGGAKSFLLSIGKGIAGMFGMALLLSGLLTLPALYQRNRICFASVILLFATLAKGIAQTPEKDPYPPQLVAGTSNQYRFTEEQLARMAHTPLDADRFVAYIERRWSLKRVQAYCVPKNVWPEGHQNLVGENVKVQTHLFKGQKTGFDRIWVYVNEDDGRSTYYGETGWRWHRWIYSLNMDRGKRFWAIIETLPNDFMDSEKYRIKE